MNNYYQTEGSILTDVDKFVMVILLSKVDNAQLALVLNYLYPAMMHHYNHELEYTKTVKWFVAVGQLLKGEYYPGDVIWDQQSVDAFIYEMRKYKPEYDMCRYTFLLQETRNTNSLEKYLKQMFTHYGRLLVVRVDLHYKVEYRGGIRACLQFILQ